MALLPNIAAIMLCAVSMSAIYAVSAQCRWPWLRRLRRAGISVGWTAALAAFIIWSRELGIGTALCVLLGCWTVWAMILPLIATVLLEKSR